MKKLLLLFILSVTSCYAFSQSLSSYAFSAFSSTYTPVTTSYITSSGGSTIGSAPYDDCYYNSISIGFNFVYCGTTYTSLSASANCWITLGQTFPFSSTLFADTYDNDLSGTSTSSGFGPYNLPRPIIAAFWSDVVTANPNVRYSTTGTAPYRVFTIEWDHTIYYGTSWAFSSPNVSVEIKLYETTNVIDFAYDYHSSGTPSSGLMSIGITGGQGAYPVTGTQPFWSLNNTSSSPTASMTTETRTMTTIPASNQVYRWDPNCNGGPVAGTVAATTLAACTSFSTTLTLPGASTSLGITYQWQASSDSLTWVNIAGATSNTYSPTITSTYYYRCIVTCTTSGLTATTPGLKLIVNTPPAAMTGTTSFCGGTTTTLSSTTPGGRWSSTGLASVGSSSGIVSGTFAGISVVTYTLPTGCFATTTVAVTTAPVAITGPATVCAGWSVTLANPVGTGSWSSGATTIATVGSTSGIVSGLIPGTSVITYAIGSCQTTTTITVMPSPPANSGIAAMCVGQTATLSNTSGGGIWTSSAPAIASVGSASGVVSGLYALTTVGSTATITYTLAGCGATTTVTINPLPTPITGSSIACVGNTMALSSPGGGSWVSSNTTIAIVGSSGIVTGVAPGSATITYTLPTGCQATKTITVNPAPAPITGTPVMCMGRSTSLSTTATGGFWISSNPGIATVNFSTGVVTGVAAGTATISYSFSSTGCASTMVVLVNPTPGPITGITGLCQGNTTTLFSASPGGYWTSTFTSVATITSSSGHVLAISLGTSAITYTLPTGCLTSVTVTVAGSPAPITGNTSVCVTNTSTLSCLTAGGTWSSGNTAIATAASVSGSVYGVSVGTSSITYRLSVGGCSSVATVTITPPPVPITGVTGLCAGNTTSLINTTPGGTWTSSATSLVTIGSTGIVSGIATGTSTITYSLGGTCLATKLVTVYPTPAPITGATVVCVGAVTSLSCATTGGTWSSSAIGITTAGVVATSAIGSYPITYTTGGTCPRTATLVVTSGPAPITGPAAVCIGETITLASATATGTWSVSPVSVATIDPITGIVTGVSSGTATVTYSLGGGCIVTTNITVNSLPNQFLVTGGGNFCAGASGVIVGLSSSSPGISYQLLLGGTAVPGAVVAGTGSGISFGLVTVPGTYTILATNTITNCSSIMTGSATIVVDPYPGPISGRLTLCIGSSGTLSALISGGTWSTGTASVATIGATSGIVSGITAGTSIVTYTSMAGCQATETVTVTPAPGPISGTLNICQGQTTTLSDSPVGGVWTSSNTLVATIGSLAGDLFGVSSGSSVITYSLGAGCSQTTTVTINPLPAAIT